MSAALLASTIAGFGFTLGGFSWLGLTIDRHHADIHGRGTEPSREQVVRLRLLGYLALALALTACVMAEGWAFGLLYWVGILSVCAWVSVATFSCAPHVTRRIARAAAAIAVIALAAALSAGVPAA
ncbi:DUF3325 domain-containing protein [Cupriavidus plantarum]|uniref:DUF3325 domain-containing protein n=1 Tax=Cupriavidus plantarum TaxID=942865 RepID=UPI000E24B5CA|nr:DUF3325 domain-containing protein [Cupriavidus plantarum]REF01975.1 uncharacterized protein DUF3325 [Cupriavidus plantarum]